MTGTRGRGCCAAILLLSSMWPAPLAGASASQRITVNRSIGPIRLGMLDQEVASRLGRPDRSFRRGAERVLRYDTRQVDIGLAESSLFDGVQVVSIRTTSRRARTSNGIGPGAPRTRLGRRLAGMRVYCFKKSGRLSTVSTADACMVGAEGFGSYGTSFQLRDDRIVSVDVYRVLTAE